ncbi:16278_t:CDS:10 [Entrophospora sp. SA101]|nr:16278_t:CDS:10 [Entrophospora sp. SA101]
MANVIINNDSDLPEDVTTVTRFNTVSSHSNSSTGNLYKHLRSQHPTKLNTNEKNITVTGTLNHFVQSKKLPPFSAESFRNFLIRWIVCSNQPFIEIENEELKNLLRLLWPGVPLPSADTIKNEIIKSFDKERSNLKELLQNIPGHISFTLDCWTSANTIPFLGITSHWINIDWQLQETLIDFVKLSGPHSGDNLREAFVASCRDLGIFAKLLAVTTDNAMNNNTFVSSLADICYNEGINFDIDNNHVHCLAHVMNIAVQHALKSLKATAANNEDEVLNIDDNDVNGFHTIMKLRKLIVKIKSSPQRRERFSKACELANLKYKELILDIVTRWNSTVGRADRDMIKWVLNEEEWSKLVEISQLLHLFSRATKHISTNHYPTLTSTVPIFNWLIDNLEDYEHNLNGTSDIKGKVKEVIEKLKFYYIRTDASVYTIATILDPRLKLDYYRDNNWEANFINNAHQVIKDIYQSGYAPNLTVFSNSENNDIEEEEDLTSHIYKRQQINHESEYPHLALMARDYLAIPATSVPVERIFSGGTDLVTATRCSLSASTIRACMCLRYWWKGNHESEYPHLALMARDYLAIPATSVPVERIFSGGTDLVTATRCSLSASTIRACMCLRYWWKGVLKNQL